MTTSANEWAATDYFAASITRLIHQVEWKNDNGSHSLTFTCFGDEHSKCHQYPDCACDFVGAEHQHPKVPHAECFLVSWFASNGEGASYDGDDGISDCDCMHSDYCPPADRIGFISTTLEDDWVNWRWIESAQENAGEIHTQ